MSVPHLGRRALAEATRTFILVLTGPGAVMVDAYSGGTIGHAGIALAFAFAVVAMIFALGHISGAHINPAVTLAFWSLGRFRGRDVPACVAAQCAGAVAASYTMGAVVGPVGRFGAAVPLTRGGTGISTPDASTPRRGRLTHPPGPR